MQIVGYETGVKEHVEPSIILASDGTITSEPLTRGRELEYALGERRCAGTINGDEHVTCDRQPAPYCEFHDSTWICARCTGTCLKSEMDCHQRHAIYLAGFAPSTFKVGVTRRSDPTVRLREQGADRGAVIRCVPDGRIARKIESDIAATVVPDSVRVSTKIEGMGAPFDTDAWERLLDGFEVESAHQFDYGLALESTPISETLAAGRVLGTKGRVLVLERSGGRFAVDMRSLVGYEVSIGPATRQLQSNLGSFG